MHLTLLVPGLLLPGEILTDSVNGLTAPCLSLMLGRGQRQELAPDWLASAFGLPPPLPAAALRKVGAGGTARGDWLCLDPVHLQVAREGIFVADPAQLNLTDEEAADLINAIQPLFTEWGEISASTPTCWELGLARSLELDTRALPDIIGQAADPGIPGGSDGRAWHRLLAEAQTVLHAHPVNRNRDALGKPTANSLWPWGAGALTAQIQANFNVVWSDDPVVVGLCAHASLPCLVPPDNFQPASGRVLAILDELARPARTLDALGWREALLAFEHNWLAPAITALKKNRCRELRLIGTCINHTPKTVALTLTRSALRRFWRRPVPLTALA